MDIDKYRAKISSPRVRKQHLEEILEILKSRNAKEVSVIERALAEGGMNDGLDYYFVECTREEAYEIWKHILGVEGDDWEYDFEPTPELWDLYSTFIWEWDT
jgi:hypothetical protein